METWFVDKDELLMKITAFEMQVAAAIVKGGWCNANVKKIYRIRRRLKFSELALRSENIYIGTVASTHGGRTTMDALHSNGKAAFRDYLPQNFQASMSDAKNNRKEWI